MYDANIFVSVSNKRKIIKYYCNPYTIGNTAYFVVFNVAQAFMRITYDILVIVLQIFINFAYKKEWLCSTY